MPHKTKEAENAYRRKWRAEHQEEAHARDKTKRKKLKKNIRATQRRFAKVHPEKVTAWYAQKRNRNPVRHLLRKRKSQALKKGIEFTITEADLLIDGKFPEFCPYLGIRLKYEGGMEDALASIDKKDNTRGYVPGNAILCSLLANRMKGKWTLEQLKTLVAAWEKLL